MACSAVRAANGPAIAIPMPAMNSRRRMCPPQGPRLWNGSLALYGSAVTICSQGPAMYRATDDVGNGSIATEPPSLAYHPMSAILPIATKIARRRNMSRWAKNGSRPGASGARNRASTNPHSKVACVVVRHLTRGTMRPCTLRSAMAIIAPAACSNRCRRGGGASRSVVAETALITMFDPRRPEDSLAPRKMGRERLNLRRRPC